uniref:Uncharacterized protein n=2 Tax=Anguilla anguilla TaxID=7936 RepID=A0A0E9U1A9_ANGAN
MSLPRPLQTSTRKARRQKLLDLQRGALRSMSMFEPGDGSVMIKSITFTLKETVCPKSEDYLKEECVFKGNGSLKSAPVQLQSSSHSQERQHL